MADPVLEALWQNVTKNWDDDGAHHNFLQHCQTTDQLIEAAVRYRGMSADRARGAAAEKQLHAITLRAMSGLETQRTHSVERSRNIGAIFLIVVFLAGSLALLATL